MKSFKKYIYEVRLLSYVDKSKKSPSKISPMKSYKETTPTHEHHPVHISTTVSGHKVWKTSKPSDDWNPDDQARYTATDSDGNKHIEILCKEKQMKNGITALHDLDLRAFRDNTLKAHEFYHHLVTHHNAMLIGKDQSNGGKSVWDKLHKISKDQNSNVVVHGWSPSEKYVHLGGQPVHVDYKKLDNIHSDETTNTKRIKTAIITVGHTKLVASPKRIKKGIQPLHTITSPSIPIRPRDNHDVW